MNIIIISYKSCKYCYQKNKSRNLFSYVVNIHCVDNIHSCHVDKHQ